jgi:AraC-like DNA-binding protein
MSVIRDTLKATGVRPFFMDVNGHCPDGDDPLGIAPPRIHRTRLYALHECVTLGQPFFFEAGPGLSCWLVALEDRRIIHGALMCGAIISTESTVSTEEYLTYLTDSLGLSLPTAQRYLATRPAMSLATMTEAAFYLEKTFYQASGWKPLQLEENKLRAQQQRQISEAIEDQRRRGGAVSYPYEKERVLLSHIRAGDQSGARRVLNEMLGAMYLTSPKLVVPRARAIEMMGYLTRTAVEDSPVMESLIQRNHQWMERLIRAKDFESLSRVLTEALNDFMEGVYLHGFNRSNIRVSRALDFISRHYAQAISLDDVAREAGLSPYRLAHLVKSHTGKSILQIIIATRIQHARQLLEDTDKSCIDIAYETGFHDQSYFIKHFKRITGITPAKYRRTRMMAQN